MDKIMIDGLEIFANHGVFPEENKLGQKFVISAVPVSYTHLDVYKRQLGACVFLMLPMDGYLPGTILFQGLLALGMVRILSLIHIYHDQTDHHDAGDPTYLLHDARHIAAPV